jgi:hypothetical protein
MPQTRLPRFRRASEVARIELTNRDQDILRQVHRHRFLRSHHLISLIGGSRQQVLRRLQLLYHHGYLDRPRAQIDYFYRGGSRAIVYGLGNKGVAFLKRELSLPYHRLHWAGKNRDTGRLYLEHTLLIAEIMIGVELACKRRENLRLLTADELPLPPSTRRQREPFHWSVNLSTRLKCGVIPDGVFGLEFTSQDGKTERAFYFLEADRGTMPITRQNLAQSSFYRKLLAYEATWTQNLHRTRFGFHRFRVLTVTSSPERAEHLARACPELERGKGLFLFTDVAAFRESEDPLSLAWQNVRGPETLLHSSNLPDV